MYLGLIKTQTQEITSQYNSFGEAVNSLNRKADSLEEIVEEILILENKSNNGYFIIASLRVFK